MQEVVFRGLYLWKELRRIAQKENYEFFIGKKQSNKSANY